jgi:hypothetical protein
VEDAVEGSRLSREFLEQQDEDEVDDGHDSGIDEESPHPTVATGLASAYAEGNTPLESFSHNRYYPEDRWWEKSDCEFWDKDEDE